MVVAVSLIFASIFIVLGGAAKGVLNIIQHKYKASIFADKNELFWNPKKSWINKWDEKRYSNGFKEKFWGSSTIFVFVTDAWHFFQFIAYNFLAIGVFLIGSADLLMIIKAILLVLALGLYKGVFELFYKYILVKR